MLASQARQLGASRLQWLCCTGLEQASRTQVGVHALVGAPTLQASARSNAKRVKV
jgi:hypothetical protein